MYFNNVLRPFPLIAILRGVRPAEVVAVAEVLIESGFRIIEVPLNSPEPFLSIELLAKRFPEYLIGAGTVMTTADVGQVHSAGGGLILMPHGDAAIIREAKLHGLLCVPGVATPTEGFAALDNGADALKLFPAEQMPPSVVKAWRAVFRPDICLIPVGGITPQSIDEYCRAGATGFGLGSALYRPGDSLEQVRTKAALFAAALSSLRAST